MNGAAIRALQVACALALLGLGALVAWEARALPIAEIGVLTLIAVGLCGLAVSELAEPPPPDTQPPRATARDAAFDAALDRAVGQIRDYLSYNHAYNDRLSGLNDGLLRLSARADVQEVVVTLIGANKEMHGRIASLSRELEASREQIASLRGNISEIGKLAMIDSLTEIGNRRFFDHAIVDEIERARLTGRELCLAIADIDRFKSVNDRFGHLVGDHLLRMFAGLLAKNVRGKGIASRFGGEEFTLLYPGTSLAEAERLVESIRRDLLAKRWVVGVNEERLGAITASFGVARLMAGETAEALIRRADSNLLRAKNSGRNRVVTDDSGAGESNRRVMHGEILTG